MSKTIDKIHRTYIDLKWIPATAICWLLLDNIHENFMLWYLRYGNVESPLYDFYLRHYVLPLIH